jgi:hypothetical protein
MTTMARFCGYLLVMRLLEKAALVFTSTLSTSVDRGRTSGRTPTAWLVSASFEGDL